MRDYTYQDMLKMQEEAAIRVREMKKRATLAVEDESDTPLKKAVAFDEVKHISYPVEIDDPVYEEPVKINEEHSSILDFLAKDKDALLILTLIAVLSMESSDYLTSCALLYLLL